MTNNQGYHLSHSNDDRRIVEVALTDGNSTEIQEIISVLESLLDAKRDMQFTEQQAG